MKKLIFTLMLFSFLHPAAARAEEGAPAGEAKVVVEIPRSQWCQCVRAVLGVEGGNIAGCVKSGASEEKLKIFRQRGTGDGSSKSVSFLLSFAGCAESENENVGSLSFNIQWQGPPVTSPTTTAQPQEQAVAPVTCSTGGIGMVGATLYRSSGEKLAAAVPWNCSNPVSTLNNIPVGSDIVFVVTGKNASGAVLYRGEQAGIAIAYKQTTALGTIAALPFTPVLSAPENGALLGSGRVRFAWTGSAGAASFQIQVSGDPGFASPAVDTAAASASYETGKDLPSGTYFWRVKSTDAYNNTSEWSSPGSITVDADPPINTTADHFINKGAAATNTNTVSLAISATKRTGVTGYYISERSKRPEAGKAGWVAIPSIASYAAAVPYTLSKRDGKKNIYVWFKDAFGHMSKVKSGSIVFDTKLPHVTITSHPAHPTNSTSARFTYTSTKPRSKFQCQLDDGAFSACTGTTSYEGLSEGPHTFMVTASDAAGNTNLAPANFTWTIDLTPPGTVITSHPPASTNSASARFDFTSTKERSTFECRLDKGDFAACTGPQDYTGLSTGSHTFAVRATDAVGNVDPTPARYTWTIAASFEATITEHPSDPSNSESAGFSFTSNRAGATFQCQLDSGSYSACSSPLAYSGLTEGGHTFSVKAVDAAGNEESEPAQYAWTVNLPATADITKALEEVPIPGSPVLVMLGMTPGIIRPASPSGLTTSLAQGIDVHGNPQLAIAVDTSPYLLYYGEKLTLQQYQDSARKRDLSRIQLSFALAKASSDNDTASRAGMAIHWTIWDDGDLRLDKELVACLAQVEGGDPAASSSGQSGSFSTEASPESHARSCRDASLKRNWNKSALEVGIAPSWLDRGKGGGLGWDGLGLWTSWSYGFDRYESLKETSQLILHARYRTDEEVAGPTKDSPFSNQDALSLGAKYRYGDPQRQIFLQGLLQQVKPEGETTDRSYLFSIGTEFRIADRLWFELELGEISGYRNQGPTGFMTVRLSGAFPEGKATK
jgi:hypothetical protein